MINVISTLKKKKIDEHHNFNQTATCHLRSDHYSILGKKTCFKDCSLFTFTLVNFTYCALHLSLAPIMPCIIHNSSININSRSQ